MDEQTDLTNNFQRTEIPYFEPDDGQHANEIVLNFLNATSLLGRKSAKTEFTDKPANEALWTMEAASNYLVNQNLALVTDSIVSYNFEMNTYTNENNVEMLAGTDMVASFENLFDFVNTQKIALDCSPKILDLAMRTGDSSVNTFSLDASIAFGCGTGTTNDDNDHDCDAPNWVTTPANDFWDEVPFVLNRELNECFINCDATNEIDQIQICDWFGSVSLFDLTYTGINTFDLDFMDCSGDCLYVDYTGGLTWTPETYQQQAEKILYVANWFIDNANTLDPVYFSLFDATILQNAVNSYEVQIKELGVSTDFLAPGGSSWYFVTLNRMILGKGYAY